MNEDALRELLTQLKDGQLDVDQALERLRVLPYEDLGFAKVDHHRTLRHGMPEVIFGLGKTPEEVLEIAKRLAEHNPNVLVTRAGPQTGEQLLKEFPQGEYFPRCQAFRLWRDRTIHGKGTIGVICAGTSDIPVAEEAQVTAEVMGNRVETLFDVGVAGLHRLLSHREKLLGARVLIVCAGMEGALPSVVGGLVRCPVIAVPTSIGYGASFHGLAALLGMLNSCASNVAVVNIDNGFGAAYVASLINRL